MVYFRNGGDVYGYDPAMQEKLIAAAQAAGWTDITASWPPPEPPPAPPTVIPAAEFLTRWQASEEIALATAMAGNPAILAGIIRSLARGTVDLTAAETTAWVAAVVTAGVLTPERATKILTP